MSYDDDPRFNARGGRRSLRRDLSSGFRRAVGLTLLGTAVPGAGLTQTRSRRWGLFLVGGFVLGIAAVAWLVFSGRVRSVGGTLASKDAYLYAFAVAVGVIGVVWCASIIATAVLVRPRSLDRGRTRMLAVMTALLVTLVGGGAYKGAEYTLIGNESLDSMFSGGKPGTGAKVAEGDDPWKDTPRVNLLLLGSDAGVDRSGTRTDSMVVASIDTKTGRTVLISLPRNLQDAPIPESSDLRKIYPGGVYGEPQCLRLEREKEQIRREGSGRQPSDYCLLNAIWRETDELRAADPSTFAGEAVPGRDQIRAVISEIVGLKIDHTVIIDLDGFRRLINTMGGVTVNVKLDQNNDGSYVRIGYGKEKRNGRWSYYFDKPGPQKMNGYTALWYARSRADGSDDNRQVRQRCVIRAVVNQVNPVAMVAKFPEIAEIAKDDIWTDIPRDNLDAFVELVQRVQKGKTTSVSLTKAAGIDAIDPDYDLIREKVQKAVNPPPAPAATATQPAPTSTTTTSEPEVTPAPPTTKPPADQDECE